MPKGYFSSRSFVSTEKPVNVPPAPVDGAVNVADVPPAPVDGLSPEPTKPSKKANR